MDNQQYRPISVMVLGLRGVPSIQGGVETHVENMYPLLDKLGCQVDIIARSPYVSQDFTEWQRIRIHRLWAPRHGSLEAFVHSFIGVIYAAIRRPDILHIHAIGPALYTPLARLLKLRVVVTHHGPDYNRQKWGFVARSVLRMGESFGMRFANKRIVISNFIRNLVYETYGVDSVVIPNGVRLPDLPTSISTIDQYGLEKGKYVLMVSRIVPEKRHADLIKAFKKADMKGWKLAIVGSVEPKDKYVAEVSNLSKTTENTVMVGFQSGTALKDIFANAGCFVLPSSHEGLPIALLEALSYGLPVLASDIPGNREIGLDDGCYFKLGDIDTLSTLLKKRASECIDDYERDQIRKWVEEKYNWDRIAEATFEVYRSAMND